MKSRIRSCCVASIALSLGVLLCSRPMILIKDVAIEKNGLRVTAQVSLEKTGKNIVGKLTIQNTSNEFAKFVNSKLFLVNGDSKSVTHVKTSVGSPKVDSSNVDLAPGDSLSFFARWAFTQPVDFEKANFAFLYDVQ